MDRLDLGCFGNWQIDPSPLDGWLVFGAGHVSDVGLFSACFGLFSLTEYY